MAHQDQHQPVMDGRSWKVLHFRLQHLPLQEDGHPVTDVLVFAPLSLELQGKLVGTLVLAEGTVGSLVLPLVSLVPCETFWLSCGEASMLKMGEDALHPCRVLPRLETRRQLSQQRHRAQQLQQRQLVHRGMCRSRAEVPVEPLQHLPPGLIAADAAQWHHQMRPVRARCWMSVDACLGRRPRP